MPFKNCMKKSIRFQSFQLSKREEQLSKITVKYDCINLKVMWVTLKAMIKHGGFFIIIFSLFRSRVISLDDNQNGFIHVDSEPQKVVVLERRYLWNIKILCIHEIQHILEMIEQQQRRCEGLFFFYRWDQVVVERAEFQVRISLLDQLLDDIEVIFLKECRHVIDVLKAEYLQDVHALVQNCKGLHVQWWLILDLSPLKFRVSLG